jgi:hypothetical protein
VIVHALECAPNRKRTADSGEGFMDTTIGFTQKGNSMRSPLPVTPTPLAEYVAGVMCGFSDGSRNLPYHDRTFSPYRKLVLVPRSSLTFADGYANGYSSGQLVWQAAHDPAPRRVA